MLRPHVQKHSDGKAMLRTVLVQSAGQVAIQVMECRPDYAAQAASTTDKGERVGQTALNPSVQETQDLPQGEPSARLDPLRVLSLVAHELRGPLHALTTSSELLLEDLETLKPWGVKNMVSSIHRRALWLQGLVENILTDATVREGRFSIQPRPGSLGDLVIEVQSVLEPLLAQKNQKIRLWSTPGLPDVHIDARAIGQVLINLLVNASKFSPRDTVIDVSLTLHYGGSVRVTVADRGPGVSPNEGMVLFEPFVRGSDIELTSNDGLGLGLSIVKSIVQAHGGRVGFENRRGGGARFWFEAPVAIAETRPDAQPPKGTADTNGN